MLHKQALASGNMGGELEPVFKVFIRLVNCVKKSIERNTRDNMDAENLALLYCCETRWLYRAELFPSVFDLKEEAGHFS
jgi:hypothetical protein